MKMFMEDFLLESNLAKELYSYAKEQPIFDYHCHLSEKQILENLPFEDFFSLWLSGDHYKWRLMRNYGVNEKYITGNASNKEKFFKFIEALEAAYGNPLYSWCHMELRFYFEIDEIICSNNAEIIWRKANEYINANRVTPSSCIEKANVKYIFTTNEIYDDLSIFDKIKQKFSTFLVLPAFRADKILNIEDSEYLDNLCKLEKLTRNIESLNDLEKAIVERIEDFNNVGSFAADIALESVSTIIPKKKEVAKILQKKICGKVLTVLQINMFKSYLVEFIMTELYKKNFTVELHIGAMRNNNSRMFNNLGADTGYDSITDESTITGLKHLLDRLDSKFCLPKCILFNLNPSITNQLITLAGCFQDATVKGKIQYGAAWWFLDNKLGIEEQLNKLCVTGHIGAFIGMLTDSRSFLSYVRHYYFRRLFCNFLANLIKKGEIYYDKDVVIKVITDVCYNNALSYLLGEKNK